MPQGIYAFARGGIHNNLVCTSRALGFKSLTPFIVMEYDLKPAIYLQKLASFILHLFNLYATINYRKKYDTRKAV